MTEHTFESWWERSGQHYAAAVIERGGTPWTDDMEERRRLWNRRYARPGPPAGLRAIVSVRGDL